ncbi:hypothetical protein [Kutzneria sp. NPDC052558]|uniref:hypothetical protein n=1 Tax=Kutzneria sp. NPDC052558 TaxID=3364121 RepID=UPI0037C65DB1
MKRIRAAAIVLAVGLAAAAVSTGPSAAQTITLGNGVAVDIPDGMTAGIMVYDRKTGDDSVQYNAHMQFRSASVVKLLIALDYLESHAPDYVIPQVDLDQLQPMLRSSDDNAASYLWVKDGWETIVQRMAAEIGLPDTAPPANRGMWGYTAISASDIVKVYRYILDRANPTVRDFIMNNLHQTTKCGNDGFDQSFGIQSALPRPWGVKQGWSGFGNPTTVCSPANPTPPAPPSASARSMVRTSDGLLVVGPAVPSATPAIDLTSRAMHTTGTVGLHDQKIVVVLTLEPVGTAFDVSSSRITSLTSAVDQAGR